MDLAGGLLFRSPMMNMTSPQCLEVKSGTPQKAPTVLESWGPAPTDVCEAARRSENVFGRYILLKPLGRGGIGEIFLAWDPILTRHVAIKKLRRDIQRGDPAARRDARESLVHEARCAPSLRHPGIVPVLELGWVGENPFVSLEYIPGRALDERVMLAFAEGWPSLFHQVPDYTLRILEELARALHHAHTAARPIVHRDLKPGNIIVDPEGHPHLLDFGFAQVLDHCENDETQVCGTPNYMAPEQARGATKDVDTRTDIYGLGAIMYELLSGRPPLSGESLIVLFRAATEAREPLANVLRKIGEDPDYGAMRLPQVPGALIDLCMACLEKDKDRRPYSALAVATLIEEIRDCLPKAEAA
jgi:serine/threonine protein kinase